MRKILPTHAFMFFSVVLLVCLVGLSFFYFWRETIVYKEEMMVDHISQLAAIFRKIDKDCGIIGFEHQKNYIDFLTVISFVGSEVGSMNLKYPQHWQGPYLHDNPTMREKYYEIVSTDKGYFIVPGDGLRLANGKVLGKDIQFTRSTDVEALVQSGILQSNGKPLAARVGNFPQNDITLVEES